MPRTAPHARSRPRCPDRSGPPTRGSEPVALAVVGDEIHRVPTASASYADLGWRRRRRCRGPGAPFGQGREGRSGTMPGGPARVPRHRRMAPPQSPLHLPDQAGLADAGDADQRHEPAATAALHAIERLDQLLELAASTDEVVPAPPVAAQLHRSQGEPGVDRGRLALEPLRARWTGRDHARGCPSRGVIHQDRSGLGRPLKPSGRVHDVAGHHPLVLEAEDDG